MIILVCGDRNWKARGPIQRAIAVFSVASPLLVIDGAARGADTLGNTVARSMNIATRRFPANWAMYGRKAGPIRNQQMLDFLLEAERHGESVVILAFHPDIEQSKGTKDIVTRAHKAGIPVQLFSK